MSKKTTVTTRPDGGNRLLKASSPYLRQHAQNPVDWYPWGEEAFSRARKEDRLVFLSIGYATCHWCHVMAHESFEDQTVGELLNRDYIAIKVDREERPDIDQVYMEIAQRFRGGGGWPLTIIMTADGMPIFTATYIPRDSRHGSIGMKELLPLVAQRWREDPATLRGSGAEIIASMSAKNSGAAALDASILQQADRTLHNDYDPHLGGFGPPPRFPRPHLLSYLLQRGQRTGDEQQLAMVEHTLDAMRQGGIYDQIGFGFHRYSTDARWLVPHFEKMLYDQAGLARTYLEAYAATGHQRFAETAQEIFTYLLREMRDPDGGFHSAEDADAEGVEGKYYVWEQAEIETLLGSEAELFCRVYAVEPAGNYREEVAGHGAGGNILHLPLPIADIAAETGIDQSELEARLAAGRDILLQQRAKRVHPLVDDKLLTAWNGMALSAFALAGYLLQQPRDLAVAREVAELLLNKFRRNDGRLLRCLPHGETAIPAFSEDYAALANGLLDLYQATQDVRWLQESITIAGALLELFIDEKDGGLFDSATDAERLILRTKTRFDGASAAAGSVALRLFVQLYRLTGDARWHQGAHDMLRGVEMQVRSYPQGFCALLAGFDLLVGESEELVIAEGKNSAALLEAARRTWHPCRTLIVKRADNAALLSRIAPFTAAYPVAERAQAWLCRGGTCLPPVDDPVALRRVLLGR